MLCGVVAVAFDNIVSQLRNLQAEDFYTVFYCVYLQFRFLKVATVNMSYTTISYV